AELARAAPGRLSGGAMTTRIGLLLFPRLTQLDLTGPYEVFARLSEAQVLLVGSAEARSDTGLRLQPDVGHADAPQLDVICVPGGVRRRVEDGRARRCRAGWRRGADPTRVESVSAARRGLNDERRRIVERAAAKLAPG